MHGGPKWKAVHLLSAEEIRRLFGDVVEGLAFLVIANFYRVASVLTEVYIAWPFDPAP